MDFQSTDSQEKPHSVALCYFNSKAGSGSQLCTNTNNDRHDKTKYVMFMVLQDSQEESNESTLLFFQRTGPWKE